jgi:hypothetical protein
MSTEMYTSQLDAILRSDPIIRPQFGGVFASDTLPKKVQEGKRLFIANTDPAHKPGTHWIAFYFSPSGVCNYFDSYGREPLLKTFISFMQHNADSWIYNSTPLQHPGSVVCGQYCVMFGHCMSRGSSMSKFASLFDYNKRFNDQMVLNYVQHHFPPHYGKTSEHSQGCCSIIKSPNHTFWYNI